MGVRRVVIVSLIAITLTACGAPAEPPPPAASTPASAPTTTTPPEIVLPPRPRDIPIDDVDPCTLLTEGQRTDLGLDGTPRVSTDSNPVLGQVHMCSVSGSEPRPVLVGVTVAPNTGIERFTSGDIAGELSAIDIGGFPAVIARPITLDDFCGVEVDVAEGQLVHVQYGEGLPPEPIPQAELCAGAQLVATAAISTLAR